MRIAVWHNLPSGGGKRALFTHVQGLLELGHYVEAWAPSSIDHDYLPLDSLITQHIIPLENDSYRLSDKVQVTLHIKRRIAAMLEHSRRCAEEILRGSFDILFANSCMFFRSPPIGRYVSLPSVLYLQEPYRWHYEAMPDPFWAAPADNAGLPSPASVKSSFLDLRRIRNARIQVREEVRNARSFGRILCNSYFSRESILRAYGIEAEVCYLGVDELQFGVGYSPRSPYVLSLGAFTREKNPQFCIEALSRIEGERPSLLWLGNVSDQGYLQNMKSLAEARGVVLDVRINVSDRELHHHMKTAFAMIYAPRLEPFGLAPIEAGACGTPVVAVAEGGVRETVTDGINGLLTDADPSAFAAAIKRLRDEAGLARRLGDQGRRLAETKWSKGAAAVRLIDKLCAEIERMKC